MRRCDFTHSHRLLLNSHFQYRSGRGSQGYWAPKEMDHGQFA